MKTASDKLIAFLNSATEFYRCDLYEITMNTGTVLRYTNYDIPITLSDGRKFLANGPVIERGRLKLSSKISVDSMNISLYAGLTDTIDGTPIMTIARNGGFDEVKCTVYICFMSAPGVIVDIVEWFTGNIDVKDGGGLELAMENKSLIAKANIDYPVRLYYPTCPYALYSAGCGLNVDNWTVEGTVTQVINKQKIYTNLTFADGYYDLGGIEFIDGELNQATMTIKSSYSENGQLIFIVALDSLPAVGDTFKAYPGCNQTPAMCKDKFNNKSKNRSTPYIPLKETVV
jgi:uncharacterized phage protein (TIGR02218 family)